MELGLAIAEIEEMIWNGWGDVGAFENREILRNFINFSVLVSEKDDQNFNFSPGIDNFFCFKMFISGQF